MKNGIIEFWSEARIVFFSVPGTVPKSWVPESLVPQIWVPVQVPDPGFFNFRAAHKGYLKRKESIIAFGTQPGWLKISVSDEKIVSPRFLDVSRSQSLVPDFSNFSPGPNPRARKFWIWVPVPVPDFKMSPGLSPVPRFLCLGCRPLLVITNFFEKIANKCSSVKCRSWKMVSNFQPPAASGLRLIYDIFQSPLTLFWRCLELFISFICR